MSLFKENKKKAWMQKSASMNAKMYMLKADKFNELYWWLDHSWINDVCDNNSIL